MPVTCLAHACRDTMSRAYMPVNWLVKKMKNANNSPPTITANRQACDISHMAVTPISEHTCYMVAAH